MIVKLRVALCPSCGAMMVMTDMPKYNVGERINVQCACKTMFEFAGFIRLTTLYTEA